MTTVEQMHDAAADFVAGRTYPPPIVDAAFVVDLCARLIAAERHLRLCAVALTLQLVAIVALIWAVAR